MGKREKHFFFIHINIWKGKRPFYYPFSTHKSGMLPNLVKFHTAWIAAKKQAIPDLEKALTGCHLLGVGGPSYWRVRTGGSGGFSYSKLIGTGSDLWNWFQNWNQNWITLRARPGLLCGTRIRIKIFEKTKGLELGPNWRLTASSRLGYLEQDQKWVWLLEPDQN